MNKKVKKMIKKAQTKTSKKMIDGVPGLPSVF